jgi:hypothetical protein
MADVAAAVGAIAVLGVGEVGCTGIDRGGLVAAAALTEVDVTA